MVQDEIKKIQEESDALTPPFTKDEFIKIKTSLDSYDYAVIEQAGLKVLAIRSPEDYPDMVNDLETAAAGLSLDNPEDLTHVTIIGNSEVIGVPVPLLVNLLQMKQEEDLRIVVTLREKLNRPLETYLFQDESDPHHLQRVGIMAPGSLEELQEKGMRDVFGGVPVPPEARVFYIVGTDGFFKFSRREYMDELEEVREDTPIIPRDDPGPAAGEVSKQVDVEMDEIDIIDHSFTLAEDEGEAPAEEEAEEQQDPGMFDPEAVMQGDAEEEDIKEMVEAPPEVSEEVEEEAVEEFEEVDDDEEEDMEEVEEFEEVEEEAEEPIESTLGDETRPMGPSDLDARPPEAKPIEQEMAEEEIVEETHVQEEQEPGEEDLGASEMLLSSETPGEISDKTGGLDQMPAGEEVPEVMEEPEEVPEEDDEESNDSSGPPEQVPSEEEEEEDDEEEEEEDEEEDDEEEEDIPEMPPVEPTIEAPAPITEEEEEALLPRPSVVQDSQEMPEHEHVVMKPLPRPSVVEEQEEVEEEPEPMEGAPAVQEIEPVQPIEEQEEEEEDILQPKEVEAPPPIPQALEEPAPQMDEVAPADTTGTEPEIVNIKKNIPMSAQVVLDERVKRERLDILKKTLTLQGFIVSPQEDIPGADFIASKRYFNDVKVLIGFYKEPSLREAMTFERAMNEINLEVGMMVCDDLTMDIKLFTVGKNLKAVAWTEIDSIDGIVKDLLI